MENNQRGQSTIEFILTFAFGLSFILVIFNSAMNYATGYLVHYATFMASRSYLTSDSHIGTIGNSEVSLAGADERAKEVFAQYNLGIFNVKTTDFHINQGGYSDPATYLTVGAYTTFEMNLDILGRIAGEKKLELVSESFLGKEVTRAECATRTCFGMTQGTSCTSNMDITLYDDGC